MFKWLDKQTVESDRGFVLQFNGRSSMQYREGARTLTISIEPGFSAGRPCVLVNAPIADWDGGVAMSTTDVKRITENIKEALNFQGLGSDL